MEHLGCRGPGPWAWAVKGRWALKGRSASWGRGKVGGSVVEEAVCETLEKPSMLVVCRKRSFPELVVQPVAMDEACSFLA